MSNLTVQLFQIMGKLSKVKRKYLKLVLVVTLKLQQVNCFFLAYFGEEQFEKTV